MKKILAFMVIASVWITAQAHQGVFAFSWIAGYCLADTSKNAQGCDPNRVALWDNQSFTIHGLWPQQKFPSIYGPFNVSLMSKNPKLFDDMNNYWPPKIKSSQSPAFLWQHQWQNHGKDYAAILFDLNPQAFPGSINQRNNALQLTFFTNVLQFYKTVGVMKLLSGQYTADQLSAKLGVQKDNFYVICAKDNVVMELMVCIQMQKTGNQVIKCQKKSQCSGNSFIFLDWKAKGQQRVTNYPNLSIQLQ